MNQLHNIALCFLLFFAFACKKKNNDPTANTTATPANIDFTYSGKQWANQPITFTTNLSDTSKIFWDFGDGKADKFNNVKHKFLTDGTYNVTLYYDGKSTNKKIKIGAGLDTIISRFTNWHLRYSFWEPNNPDSPFIPSIYFPDTDIVFSLHYISCDNDSIPYAIVIPWDGIVTCAQHEKIMTLFYMSEDGINSMSSEGTCSIYTKGDSAIIETYAYPCIYNGKTGRYSCRYTSK